MQRIPPIGPPDAGRNPPLHPVDILKLFRIRHLTIYLIDRGKRTLHTRDDGGNARNPLPQDYTLLPATPLEKKCCTSPTL
jgi:hypothetical protein